MNSWDKCKNCGGDYALHHYETNQCPRNGVEAPLNRKQEWMTTTFELVDTRDAQIAALRADLATAQATVAAIRELIDPLDGQTLEDAISDMLHDDSSYEPYRETIAQQAAQIESMELERGELILARDYARGQVDEQAAQLERAQLLVFEVCARAWMPQSPEGNKIMRLPADVYERCRAWLAANPAPASPATVEQSTIIDAYADGM